jgi:hypothetical protein
MAFPGRWRSLNELRDEFAASGIELPKPHWLCRGKTRHATHADAALHVDTLRAKATDHESRRDRLMPYWCAWCSGFHVGHRPQSQGRRYRGRRVERG